jgi:hypothetical protein
MYSPSIPMKNKRTPNKKNNPISAGAPPKGKESQKMSFITKK